MADAGLKDSYFSRKERGLHPSSDGTGRDGAELQVPKPGDLEDLPEA